VRRAWRSCARARPACKRLQTDYIDLYQLHWPDHDTPIDETLRALDDLVRAGKVRYIGASNMFAWELCEAHFVAEQHGWSKFISAQDHYNLLYRDIEKRFEPFCVKYGIGMTHYFPLAAGMLTGVHKRGAIAPGSRQDKNPNTAAWQSDRNWDVTGKLQAFAQERGWTLAQMSLAWLLQRPATFTVIAGADQPQHLVDNVKALQVRFTPDDLVEIDRITLVDEDRSVAPPYRQLRPEKVHEFEPMQRARAGAPSRAAH
jgi:aryl-alcohol dehydrogenase-like predicted oxidoreductase